MRATGLRAIYRRPSTSRRSPKHAVYPYLLRNIRITRPNQSLPPTPIGGVGGRHHLPAHGSWIPVPGGGDGLAQPVRVVLATVHTLDAGFCVAALEEALGKGKPEAYFGDFAYLHRR